MKHPKKLAGAGILGILLPFIVGADGDDAALSAGPHDPGFWLIVVKLALAALAPTIALVAGVTAHALGAGVRAYGKALKADNNPSNDALGEALIAAGDKIDPPEKTTLQLAPPPSTNSETPKTGT